MHNTPGTDKDRNLSLKYKILIRIAVLGATLGLSLMIGAAGAVFSAYHYALPNLPDAATVRDIPLEVPLRVYSRDGRLIQEIGERRRIPVTWEEIPDFVVHAFVAAEDKRFFEHGGIDPIALVRALTVATVSGRSARGTSTLTQQLTRDYFLSRDRTIVRKLREAFLAYKIEQEFTKEEIMTLFLNKMFFGQRAYGVGAAAQIYFDRDLAELNIAEAATLAGVLPAPSRANPVNGPEYAKRRRSYVLGRMLDLGYIDDAQYREAMDHPMLSKLHGPDIELSAPYLAEMVRRDVVNRYGTDITTRGYNVYTTIDSSMQRAANYAVRDGLLEYDRRHGYRGALATLELDGVDEPAIEQALSDFAEPGGLRTALVTATDVATNTASIRLAGGETARIPWQGMSWAAKHIDRNRIGDPPETVDDILAPGDLVYVIDTVSGFPALAQLPESQGAIVALDPTDGAVAALTGGFDYAASKFNRAVQAKRQPGSSFKPFIYSAALANGFTAASIINDAPIVIESAEYEGVWRPKNYSGRFFGEIRMREALRRSLNLVSVRMVLEMGVSAARRHIRAFGFNDEALPSNLSLALGSGAVPPLEMASAYSVLANGGYLVEPYYIDRIELADGTLLEAATPRMVCSACDPTAAQPRRAPTPLAEDDTRMPTLSPEDLAAQIGEDRIAPRVVPATNVWIVQDLMRDVIRFGTGRRALTLGRGDLAGKTGTSNDQRDAWFAGFNPDLAVVAWVGFDSDEPLGAGEEGGRTALPMWIHFMRDAMAGAPERSYPQPPGLVTVRVSPKDGSLAGVGETNFIFETFINGTEPERRDDAPTISPFGDDDTPVELDDVF